MSRKCWFLGLAVLLVTASSAEAQRSRRGGDVYVRGYIRSDGRYVAPHMRSRPDGNPYNNWSTRGNINPYTGKLGTKSPYPSHGALWTGRSSSGYGYALPPVPSDRAVGGKPQYADTVKPEAAEKRMEVEPARQEPDRNPEEAAERAEATASAKLSLWKQLIELEKTELAKFRLQDLIRDYPKTKAAEEARALLKKL